MDKALPRHYRLIENILENELSEEQLEILFNYHRKMTSNFQAERLLHLIVTMCFALFTLLFTITSVVTQNLMFLGIAGLLLVLLIPYIFHYYQLENGVQKLYQLDKMILDRQLK